MEEIVAEFSRQGISRLKITGGEPFCREGLIQFIQRMYRLSFKDISITTNGTLTEPYLEDLFISGLKRITFSLDSLSEGRYRQLSGKDMFHKVWRSIHRAAEVGFDPIKINTVLVRGINDDEIISLADLTRTMPFHLRFVELMQQGESNEDWQSRFIPNGEVQGIIEDKIGQLICTKRLDSKMHVKTYRLDGARGTIGFISPNSGHFCEDCSKMRLTSKGVARTCLRSSDSLDLRPALGNSKELSKLVSEVLVLKEAQLKRIRQGDEKPMRIVHPMVEVGG
jgi:cyclic pyranopterin phosphate synthase